MRTASRVAPCASVSAPRGGRAFPSLPPGRIPAKKNSELARSNLSPVRTGGGRGRGAGCRCGQGERGVRPFDVATPKQSVGVRFSCLGFLHEAACRRCRPWLAVGHTLDPAAAPGLGGPPRGPRAATSGARSHAPLTTPHVVAALPESFAGRWPPSSPSRHQLTCL